MSTIVLIVSGISYVIAAVLLFISYGYRSKNKQIADYIFDRSTFFLKRTIKDSFYHDEFQKHLDQYIRVPVFDLYHYSDAFKHYLECNSGIFIGKVLYPGGIALTSSALSFFLILSSICGIINVFNNNWIFAGIGIAFLIIMFTSNISAWFPTRKDTVNFERTLMNYKIAFPQDKINVNKFHMPGSLQIKAFRNAYIYGTILGISYVDYLMHYNEEPALESVPTNNSFAAADNGKDTDTKESLSSPHIAPSEPTKNAIATNNAEAEKLWSNGYNLFYGVLSQKNKATGFKLLYRAAELGHPKAQFEIGKCYGNGDNVEFNRGESFKWYLKAAKQNHSEAQYETALCYEIGLGVEENIEEAINWYEKAIDSAEQEGDPEDLIDVAEENIEELKELLEKKNELTLEAKNGDSDAQYELGKKYFYGGEKGFPQNFDNAKIWLSKAAIQEDNDAQFELGNYYSYFAGLCELSKSNNDIINYLKESRRWYEEASDYNDNAEKKVEEIDYLLSKGYYNNISVLGDNNTDGHDSESTIIPENQYGVCLPEDEIAEFWRRYYNKLSIVNEIIKEKASPMFSNHQECFGYNVNGFMSVFKHIQLSKGWIIDYLVFRTPSGGETKFYMRKEYADVLKTEEEYNEKVNTSENYKGLTMFISDETPMAYYEYSVLLKFFDGLYRYDHSWYGHDSTIFDEKWELQRWNAHLANEIDVRPRYKMNKSFCVITRFITEKNGSYGYIEQGFDKNNFEIISSNITYLHEGNISYYY